MSGSAGGDSRPTAPVVPVAQRRHIRVWFGEHVVADYRAETELAERYAAAMSRRFAGLRVTNDPIHAPRPDQALPGKRLSEGSPD
jgi:hypothetical protein